MPCMRICEAVAVSQGRDATPQQHEIISETDALTAVRQLEDEIMNWISVARRRHVLDDHEYTYLRHHTRAKSKDPFSCFYLMY